MGRPLAATSKIRPAATPAWENLLAVLAHTTPDCADDPRYIADHNDPADTTIMGAICAACPILTECTEYAVTEKPAGGWWPGHNLTIQREEHRTNERSQ